MLRTLINLSGVKCFKQPEIILLIQATLRTPTSQVTWRDVVDVSFVDGSLAALRTLIFAKVLLECY